MYTDNSQKATQWLRALVPSGPINIVTANIEKFGATVKTRTFTDDAAMTAHIAAELERGRDVWFQVNECEDREYWKEITRKDGTTATIPARPTEDDVRWIRCIHLDIDFKDYLAKYPNGTIDALLNQLQVGGGLSSKGKGLTPTAFNKSGGGYHAFWMLKEPLPATPENIARVTAINAFIIDKTGAKRGTQDVSRLLRVAYTINGKPERNGAMVTPYEEDGPRYSIDDFGTSDEKLPLDKKKSTDLVKVGEAVAVNDLSKLGLRFPDDHDTIALIVWSPPEHDPASPWGEHQGRGFEQPPLLHHEEAEKYFDEGERSERVLSVVSRLAKRKVPVEMICGVLLNPAFGVSAHVLDQTSPALYAKHQCRHIDEPVVVGELISLAPIPDDLTPPPIFVPNWLMDRKVSILAGRGGVGKSTLSLTLAVSVAMGQPLLGFKPKGRRKVLVLNTEDDIDIMHYRLWAICQAHGINHRELEGWLFTKNLVSLELIAKVESDDGTEFVQTPLYQNILKKVETNEIGLLIVDPFAETFDNCDENSNSDMKKVIIEHRKALALLGQPVCLLLCHHTRKGYSQEGSEADAIRGGGSLVNHARYAQMLEPLVGDEKKAAAGNSGDRRFVKLTDAKRNYERESDKIVLEFASHQHPTGFNVAAFIIPDLTVIDPGLDIDVWPGLEKTLAEVRSRYTTRPFRPGGRGDRGTRLDAWVQDTFSLNKDDTELVIEKLFKESKVLSVTKWKDPSDRKFKDAVIVTGDDLPPALADLPF